MSVSYKRSFAASKRHIYDRIKRAEDLLKSALPTSAEECQQAHDQASVVHGLLAKSIETLNNAAEEWRNYCMTIRADTADPTLHRAEGESYQTYLSQDDNHLEWIFEAEERQALLACQMQQLDKSIAQLQATPAVGESHPVSNPTSSRYLTVKPPKLQLPEFEGDPLKWKSFWGIFEVNIHDRPGLSNIEKMSYLLPLLKGTAKIAVDGLLITDRNYEVVVDLLKKRFDRSDDRLIAMLLGQLKRMPQAGNGCVPTREKYDHCERIFRQLTQSGEDVDSSRTLSLDYLSKFHPKIFQTLEHDYQITAHSKLGELRTAMGTMLSRWEVSVGTLKDLAVLAGTTSSTEAKGSRDWEKSQFLNEVSSESETSALAVMERRERKILCPFCDGEHKGFTCRRYATPQARLERVKERGHCEQCTFKHEGRCARPMLCFACQKKGHVRSICLNTSRNFQWDSKSEAELSSSQNSTQKQEKHADLANLAMYNESNLGRASLFPTARVQVSNPETNTTVTLRLCLDTLSGRSYITDAAAAKLQLQSEEHDKLIVAVFGTQKRVEMSTQVVHIAITQRDGSKKVVQANTTKLITNAGIMPATWPESERKVLDAWLRSGALADNPFGTDGKVDILIGADYAWDFILGPKMDSENEMSLIPTTLGLMLAGRISGTSDAHTSSNLTMLCIMESPCQFPTEIGCLAQTRSAWKPSYPDVDEYWNLESIGITDCPVADDDEYARQLFEKSVQFVDGRYTVKWPWIPGKREMLPSNWDVAMRRFRSLSKRLQEDSTLLEGYRDVIRQQVEKNVIERVPDDELQPDEPVHYLCHHPIIRPSHATTKIRVVYDASAKQKKSDVSLNECLFKGPTILPDLCQLLIRFRTYPIAVISDVEKAFLQVGLQPTERDVTRFLWFKDDRNPNPTPENIAVYRFTRVLFGVISSPFLLGSTIQHHLRVEDTVFAESLSDDSYVDNLISGCQDDESAEQYYIETKAIFRRAGMNLQQYCSNSRALMSKIPAADAVSGTTTKVLGLGWNTLEDTLSLRQPNGQHEGETDITKRFLLHTVASVFDPLGLFQPVLFPAKLFLQRLWLNKQDWDTPLSEDLAQEWEKLQKAIRPIQSCTLPRYEGSPTEKSSLVIFCDASKAGYGAAVYLRNWSNDRWKTNMIFAKSRLAPLPTSAKGKNTVTIPRLELLAMTIAVKLAEFCKAALRRPAITTTIFTDSMCVWHWIRVKDPSTLKRFVANRVEVIQKAANCQFRYVRTHDNPADYLTRGRTANELLHDPLWWSGPPWLKEEEETWSRFEGERVPDSVLDDVKSESRSTAYVMSLATVQQDGPRPPFNLDPTTLSSWQGLITRTATILIALKKLLWARLRNSSRTRFAVSESVFENISDHMPPAAMDLACATHLWVEWAQASSFQKVILDIRASRKNPLVRQLGLCLDEQDILRSHGRFSNADVPNETKYPILLPENDHLTRLLIMHIHHRIGHSGVSHTLTEIRQKYWIPHGRARVKSVLRSCLICRKYKSLTPFALPEMPPWPKERMSRSAVFQYVGLDYFGPIKVKVSNDSKKMWAVVFTCLASRAVHLEPVHDCTTQEFLQAMIRFVSRRGCPHQVISDNAAQFRLTAILAADAWRRVPSDESILKYAASHGIHWKFITELAPWQGGHYERLVGVVKSVMKTAIGRRLLSWSEFVTLLCETEAIVNSRPLTYVASDIGSQGQVIRPVDFLTLLDTGLGLSDSGFPARDLGDAAKHVAAMWKRKKTQLDSVWNTWYREYLSALRERGVVGHAQRRSTVHRSPREGEVVILKNEDLPRGCWKLAKVTKLIRGADGNIRSAEITLGNGVSLRRAVNFLIPLEIECTVEAGALPQARQDNDEDDFYGFSQNDVRRIEDLLQHFDDQDEG